MASKLFKGTRSVAGLSDSVVQSAKKIARELREKQDLPTQPLFAKDPDIQEGAGLGPTGFAVSAERAVGTKDEKVNIPMDETFMTDDMLRGASAQAKRLNEIEGKIFTRESIVSGDYELKPDADPALVSEHARILKRNAQALTSRNVSISQTSRAGKYEMDPETFALTPVKKTGDDFDIAIDRSTGEINEEAFNRLTENQQNLLLQDIRQRFKGEQLREIEAKVEQARLQAGDVKPGESAISTRTGTRGLMVRSEEKQLKEMISGTNRDKLTKTLKPETEEAVLETIKSKKGSPYAITENPSLLPSDPLEIGTNPATEGGAFLKNYDMDTVTSITDRVADSTAGSTAANKLINAPVEEGTKVGIRLNLNSSIPDMPAGLNKLQTVHKNNYNGKALSYQGAVTVEDAVFSVNQKGRQGIGARVNQIDVPEAKSKFPAMSVDGKYTSSRNVLDEMDDDVIEIAFNPKNTHLFYDVSTGQAVKSADVATIIGDRVYAKGVTYWKKSEAPEPLKASDGTELPNEIRYKFKQGGLVSRRVQLWLIQ